ncbi:MAG: phage minor head protein [Acidobacteriota bacterium]
MPQQHGANFDRKVREIIEAILTHEETSIRNAMTMLDQLRRDLTLEMRSHGISEFQLSIYRQIERAAEATLNQFRLDLEARFRTDLNTSVRLGLRLAEEPMVSFAATPLAGITPQLAIVAAEYSLAYVSNLSIAAKDQILGIIRRAALGGLQIGDAIKQVGTSLTSAGAFKSIAARAETIVRTEVLRVQAIATQARMMEDRDRMRRIGYDLQKQWLTADDERVRISHRLINGQVREIDKPFDVPIGIVGLIAGSTEELLYPRDPKGSAANTVNCRCVASPVVIEMAVTTAQSNRGRHKTGSGFVVQSSTFRLLVSLAS